MFQLASAVPPGTRQRDFVTVKAKIIRISNLVHNAFRKKNGSVRYTHIKVTRAKGYFAHDINGDGNMYTADNICKMIGFLIDNIFVQFEGYIALRLEQSFKKFMADISGSH